MNRKLELIQEIIYHGVNLMKDGVGQDQYTDDLHHYLYNEDYYVIGSYHASTLIEQYGTFELISTVRGYEITEFGEFTTGVNAEKLMNMFAYIVGQIALNNVEFLNDYPPRRLSGEHLVEIIEQMKNLDPQDVHKELQFYEDRG